MSKQSSLESKQPIPKKVAKVEESTLYSLGKFVFIVGGIYSSFSWMAISQEKYFNGGGIPFPFIQTLVVYILAICMAAPIKYMIFKDYTTVIPAKNSIVIGVAVVMSQALSLYGFSRVSFFIGNMIKSSKTLATLVYRLVTLDFAYIQQLKMTTKISVVLITIGIIAFNLAKPSKKDKETDVLGFACLFVALFIDAFYTNKQTDVIKNFKPTIMDLQISLSAGSVLGSCIGLLGKSEFKEATAYFMSNPEAFQLFLTTCITVTVGQFFIYACIHEYGGLRLTMITGSRKILTVVLSMIIFNHEMNNIQLTSVG